MHINKYFRKRALLFGKKNMGYFWAFFSNQFAGVILPNNDLPFVQEPD
jgi:hypothetical protein